MCICGCACTCLRLCALQECVCMQGYQCMWKLDMCVRKCVCTCAHVCVCVSLLVCRGCVWRRLTTNACYNCVPLRVLGKPKVSLSTVSQQQHGLSTQVYRAVYPPWTHQLQPTLWTNSNTHSFCLLCQTASTAAASGAGPGVRDHFSTENPFVRTALKPMAERHSSPETSLCS